MGAVPQVFERSMFKCRHPRQRAPDGHWMACAAFECIQNAMGRYYVVPVLTDHAIHDQVFRRANTIGGVLWSRCDG